MLDFFSKEQKDKRLFLQLARQGDAAALEEMIRVERSIVNVCDGDGMTALLYAARDDNPKALDVLIKRGADINAVNERNENGVILAIKDRHFKILKKLIDAGSDINHKDKNGRDAMYFSMRSRDFAGIAVLLRSGAQMILEDRQQFIFKAIESRAHGILQALVDKTDILDFKDDYNATPLYRAMEMDDEKSIAVLIKGGACFHDTVLTSDKMPFLIWAMVQRKDDLVRLLLEKGTALDVTDTEGNTALHVAVARQNLLLINALFQSGIDPEKKNDNGETALMLAIKRYDRDGALNLLDLGAKPEGVFSSEPVLINVIKKGWLDIADKMIEKGASLDVVDDNDMTARTYLALARKKEAEEALVSKPGVPIQKVIWQKPDDERIVRNEMEPALGRVLKDIFNFTKRERLSVLIDPKTGRPDTMSVTSFDQMPDKEILREALSEFEKQGGKVDPQVIHARLLKRNMTRLG